MDHSQQAHNNHHVAMHHGLIHKTVTAVSMVSTIINQPECLYQEEELTYCSSGNRFLNFLCALSLAMIV